MTEKTIGEIVGTTFHGPPTVDELLAWLLTQGYELEFAKYCEYGQRKFYRIQLWPSRWTIEATTLLEALEAGVRWVAQAGIRQEDDGS